MNQYYKSIVERFMSAEEVADFERKYNASKSKNGAGRWSPNKEDWDMFEKGGLSLQDYANHWGLKNLEDTAMKLGKMHVLRGQK